MNNTKVLESNENGIIVLIERDLSLGEVFKMFTTRKLKELVFLEVDKCIQYNTIKQKKDSTGL